MRRLITPLLAVLILLWVSAYVRHRSAEMPIIGWGGNKSIWYDTSAYPVFSSTWSKSDLRNFYLYKGEYWLLLPLNLADRYLLGNDFSLSDPFYWTTADPTATKP